MDQQTREAPETDRVVDITTTGRTTGQPRHIEDVDERCRMSTEIAGKSPQQCAIAERVEKSPLVRGEFL